MKRKDSLKIDIRCYKKYENYSLKKSVFELSINIDFFFFLQM